MNKSKKETKREKESHVEVSRLHPFSPKVFENMAKERIVFLRNAVWTHLNHLSQQCVVDDEVGKAL